MRRSRSEVRLPQGLRFTDVRRSAIGDFPLARGGSRAAKSHGCLELRPPSRLLCSLRLPSAASFFCANLRCLLDGVSRLRADLLCARCGDTLDAPIWPGLQSPALCRACRLAPPPFARAVAYGPYQDRMKEAIHALKYDRLHPAAQRLGRMLAEAIAQLAGRGAGRDAGGSRAAAPVKICRARLQSGAVAGRDALGLLRKTPSRVAAHAGLEHADAAARHREPGRAHAPPAAPECARSLHGLRSGRSHAEACSGDRRHFHDRRHGASWLPWSVTMTARSRWRSTT